MNESQRTQKVATFCMEMINKYTSTQDNRVVHVCHKQAITELAKIEFPTNWKTIVQILFFGY
jgi:hypothetical protein